MTALTPGCDPDMSITGSPFGAASGGGRRLRSGAVLLVVGALSFLLATGDSVPGGVRVPAVVVALFCALVLIRRGVRLARRAWPVAASPASRAADTSRPVPTATT